MRIAVVGAYGSGKTTLTDQLAHALSHPVSRATPMARPLGSTHVAASECTPAELVQLAVRRLVERSVEEERHVGAFVSDGSVLHDWVYAEWLLRTGSYPAQVPADAAGPPVVSSDAFDPLTLVHQVALLSRHRVAERYDLWIHVPVEHALQDAVPPISEAFRHATDLRLLGVLAAEGVRPHVVRGTPDARLAQALALVEEVAAATGETAHAAAGVRLATEAPPAPVGART
ncbi:AAA family ATPase [Cellulomonas sp. NPDC055163]